MSILAILKATAPFISAGATIGAGLMQNRENRAINKEALELAYKQREDTLKEQERLAGQRQQQIDLSRQSLRWQKEQAEAENKRLSEQTNYERLQRAGSKLAEYLNQKNALSRTRMSGFQRR